MDRQQLAENLMIEADRLWREHEQLGPIDLDDGVGIVHMVGPYCVIPSIDDGGHRMCLVIVPEGEDYEPFVDGWSQIAEAVVRDREQDSDE
jgi:hypothetical protein